MNQRIKRQEAFKRNPHQEKSLRRNPIENRAISGFSGQKSGIRRTRIILSLLQSFLHSLELKIHKSSPDITPKTISHGNERK